jgi:hypothetical protein
MLELVKSLDAKVDEYSANAMKIKDKETRKALMEEVISCKTRTGNIVAILAASAGGAINNQIIA